MRSAHSCTRSSARCRQGVASADTLLNSRASGRRQLETGSCGRRPRSSPVLPGSLGRQRLRDFGKAVEAFNKRFSKKNRAARQPVAAHEAAAKAAVKELISFTCGCCARKLEPSLIILDEFQRFHNLLKPSTSRDGRLATPHLLENWFFGTGNQSRVALLLLSATPYRLYFGPQRGSSRHKAFEGVLCHYAVPPGCERGRRMVAAPGCELQGFSQEARSAHAIQLSKRGAARS